LPIAAAPIFPSSGMRAASGAAIYLASQSCCPRLRAASNCTRDTCIACWAWASSGSS
jgi:hypothetical protein